jgi:hypothetical protein
MVSRLSARRERPLNKILAPEERYSNTNELDMEGIFEDSDDDHGGVPLY